MKKQLQLVTFEQANKLKELDFDWETDALYFADDKSVDDGYDLCNHNDVTVDDEWTCEVFSAPTVALALKWVRDVKKCFCAIGFWEAKEIGLNHNYYGLILRDDGFFKKRTDYFEEYELAESALLDELIKILEEQK